MTRTTVIRSGSRKWGKERHLNRPHNGVISFKRMRGAAEGKTFRRAVHQPPNPISSCIANFNSWFKIPNYGIFLTYWHLSANHSGTRNDVAGLGRDCLPYFFTTFKDPLMINLMVKPLLRRNPERGSRVHWKDFNRRIRCW